MVLPIIIQKVIERAVPYVSNILRAQGRVVDYTYTRPFLSRNINPYVRRGIKHGLAGGQVIGGLQELNSVGNFIVPDAIQTPFSRKHYLQRKTRSHLELSRAKREYCPSDKRRGFYRRPYKRRSS